MSTTTLAYPNHIQVRRGFSVRWIVILIASVALILSATLVITASVTRNSVSSDSLSNVVAIPVPVAPTGNTEILPVQTATPAPSPAAIAVPVPTPPSQ